MANLLLLVKVLSPKPEIPCLGDCLGALIWVEERTGVRMFMIPRKDPFSEGVPPIVGMFMKGVVLLVIMGLKI